MKFILIVLLGTLLNGHVLADEMLWDGEILVSGVNAGDGRIMACKDAGAVLDVSSRCISAGQFFGGGDSPVAMTAQQILDTRVTSTRGKKAIAVGLITEPRSHTGSSYQVRVLYKLR